MSAFPKSLYDLVHLHYKNQASVRVLVEQAGGDWGEVRQANKLNDQIHFVLEYVCKDRARLEAFVSLIEHQGYMTPYAAGAVQTFVELNPSGGSGFEPTVLESQLMGQVVEQLEHQLSDMTRGLGLFERRLLLVPDDRLREVRQSNLFLDRGRELDPMLEEFGMEEMATGDYPAVMLESPAGFGKSIVALELAIRWSREFKLPAFLIPGARLRRSDLQEGAVIPSVIEGTLGSPSVAIYKRAIEEGAPVLLILDGINEVSAEIRLMNNMLDVAVSNPLVRVLATRRPAYGAKLRQGYQAVALGRLATSTVSAELGVDADAIEPLLRIPFFLQLARLHPEGKGLPRTQRIEIYLLESLRKMPVFGDLSDLDWMDLRDPLGDAVRTVCDVALTAYLDENPSTVFSQSTPGVKVLLDILGGQRAAIDAGVLMKSEDGTSLRFWHQLVHDWAAVQAALGRLKDGEWSASKNELFEKITLARQSTDPIVLFIERLVVDDDHEAAEGFVVDIYDWDYPSAVDTLNGWTEVAATSLELPKPSDALRLSVYAAIAEKGFDRFEQARSQWRRVGQLVEDGFATLLTGSMPVGEALVSLDSLREAVEQVSASVGGRPGWFDQWARLFSEQATEAETVAALRSDSSMIGWCAANVLQRGAVEQSTVEAIVETMSYPGEGVELGAATASGDRVTTVRWRAVHAAAGTPNEGVVEALFAVVRRATEHQSVRYGAFRSLLSLCLLAEESLGTRWLSAASNYYVDAEGGLGVRRLRTSLDRIVVPAVEPRMGREAWEGEMRKMIDANRERGRQDDLELATKASTLLDEWILQ